MRRQPDPELQAMRAVARVLSDVQKLDGDTMARVVIWAKARLDAMEPKEGNDGGSGSTGSAGDTE